MIYLDKLVIYLICVLGIFYHFYGFFSVLCVLLFFLLLSQNMNGGGGNQQEVRDEPN